MQGLLYEENSFGVFLLVTVVLGGAGAWLSGRAIARIWRPWWTAALAMLVLGFAVRFVHFALFDGTLLSPWFYAVDTAILIAIALLGFRTTRRRQMARQYGFLLAPSAPD
ncbi:hypothetical protein PQJ75_17715 [Rhodoplanes sp. TEM]|uniref:DUF6867 domain-containing protein n=1 Tax=Rhodoplanes tepidamans TaxID=200616 RepID=A0ABT5JHZ3_RHOTP|nr:MULTISPECIES: hypothetical protein [Rhodoplanes]MDC7789221.1 hypothetical protein [Rhodoplanes tepidamans]MDC7985571.1 hypothetical protein [Rhodoplanes sp. TEM]MDQ0355299.1 hypothetical protein [Rhodoplanes tepidamans]